MNNKKKNNKKIIALLLAVLVFSTAVFGCSSEEMAIDENSSLKNVEEKADEYDMLPL